MSDRNKGFNGSGLLKILACMVPMLLLFYLFSRGGLAVGGPWLFLLICPLMHILMMFMMRGEGSCHGSGHHRERDEGAES